MLNKIYLYSPIFISFLISFTILIQLDKKYKLIKKLDSKIKIKQELKPVTYVSSMLIIIILLGTLNIKTTVYYYLVGIILGISIVFTTILKN